MSNSFVVLSTGPLMPKYQNLGCKPPVASAIVQNADERQDFAKLARRRRKRGVFRSVDDLKAAINRFVAETSADPKPFVWAANPKRVLAAINRGKQVLESIH